MNFKLLKIGVLLVLIALGCAYHVQDKHKAVKEAITATTSVLNQKYDKALRDEETKALKASKDLQASADQMRNAKDEKINSISKQLDVALISLRTRPSRPTTIANDPPSSTSCTGRELYREDGEFLTREAARAESVLAERDYYYEQYEEVRKKYGNTK